MGGLKEEIGIEVQTHDPPTHYEAVSMAQNIERKLIKARAIKAPISGRKHNSFPRNYS